MPDRYSHQARAGAGPVRAVTGAAVRRLVQPGPAAPRRTESVAGRGRILDLAIEPGADLVAAVAAPILAAGFEAAAVEIAGGSFAPFTYVIPAASPDDRHAAWYSEPFSPPGESRIEAANLMVGRRDGAPFVHCHACWIEADGRRRAGHPIPDRTVFASRTAARAWCVSGVALRSEPDPETNFTLFRPVAIGASAPDTGPRMALARIRPNEDACAALAAVCRTHGFAAAALRGSLGSVIDPAFTDGRRIGSDSTELLVRDGAVRADASGEVHGRLDVVLVDVAGRVHEGRLAPGRNPVCITFEALLEELPA